MKQYTISDLLNIRASEWPRLLLLYSMLFLFFLGLVWGDIALEAAFLTEVGARSLAWFFILRAAMAVPAVALYTAFADRVPNNRLLYGLLGLSGAGLLGGLALLQQGYTQPAYLLMYLLVPFTELTVFTTHWYTYVSGFYDTQEAKRIVPVLGTAAAIAAITAGQTMPLLQETLALSTSHIVLIWIGTLAGMGLLARLMPLLLHEQRTPPTVSMPRTSYTAHIREGHRYVVGSVFLRWMALAMLLLLILFTLLQFQAGRIFEASFTSAGDLAIFLGHVVSIANLILLPVQLLLLSRIIGAIGLGTTYMIYPLGALIVCGGLGLAAALPAIALPLAALAYFTRTDFHGSFGYAVNSLLYNAVPPHVKGRARAFIGGLVVPCGLLVGGLLLLLPLVEHVWFIPTLLVLIGAAYVASAWMVRRCYRQALLGLLGRESSPGMADVAPLPGPRRGLERQANLLQHDLTAQQDEAPDGEALLVATDFLSDADSQVRLAAICGIERLAPAYGARLRPLLLPSLRDSHPDVAAHGLLVLAQIGPLDDLPLALALLDDLLTHPEPARRVQGIAVLAQRSDAAAGRRLLPLLHDPADGVRLAAAQALEQSDPGAAPAELAAEAETLLADPLERIRSAALVLLERGAGPAATPTLVRTLADPSATVRETAAAILYGCGRATLPEMQQALEADNPQIRQMAAVVLSRLEPARFAPLINVYIMSNTEAAYIAHGLHAALAPYAACPSIGLLRRTLYTHTNNLRAEIVYLLTIRHPDAPIERLHEALRSDDDQRRANAAEVLETLTSPQISRLLVPLFAEHLPPEHLLAIGRHTWDMPTSDLRAALRFLLQESQQSGWRAVAALALAELSSSPTAPLARAEVRTLLHAATSDPADEVRIAAHAAQQMLAAATTPATQPANGINGSALPIQHTQQHTQKEAPMLSSIERIMFLQSVPFFQGMTIEQLRVVAAACEEASFPPGVHIITEGEPSSALYVIVQGQVEITYVPPDALPGNAPTHLATLGAHAHIGEMTLFDNQPASASALALTNTSTLKLHREQAQQLCHHYPDLSLALIHVLSQRLREANQRISELSHEHALPLLTKV
jgi:HEAT repeat protein